MTSWSPDLVRSGTGVVPCEMSESAPLGPVLPAISRFIDFTVTSAWQLAWGWYADDMLWWMPQLVRNVLVVCEANSGSPSEVSESGIPKVAKVSWSVWVRPMRATVTPPLNQPCRQSHPWNPSTRSSTSVWIFFTTRGSPISFWWTGSRTGPWSPLPEINSASVSGGCNVLDLNREASARSVILLVQARRGR